MALLTIWRRRRRERSSTPKGLRWETEALLLRVRIVADGVRAARLTSTGDDSRPDLDAERG